MRLNHLKIVRFSGRPEALTGLYLLFTALVLCLLSRTAPTAQDRQWVVKRLLEEGQRLQFGVGTKEALQEAIRKYEEALKLCQDAQDQESQRNALGRLAFVYASLADYRRAVSYLNQAVEVLHQQLDKARVERDRERQVELSRLEAIYSEHMGLYYQYLGDKEAAVKALDSALDLHTSRNDKNGIPRTLTLLGQLYTKIGNGPAEKRKAVEYLERVLGIQREVRNQYGEGDALTNLMLAWRGLQSPRVAIFYGKEAVNTFQAIRSSIADLEKDTQETFAISKTGAYRVLADLLIAEGRLPEAQEVLSLLKEQEYFEFIRRDPTSDSAFTGGVTMTPAEAGVKREYESIAAIGKERGELRRKESRSQEEEDRLSLLEHQLGLANQKFEQDLDQLAKELGDTKLAARVESIRAAQAMMEDLQQLGQGTVALYTLVGAEKYRVILITPDTRKAYEYDISAADLAHKVNAYRESIQDRKSDPRPQAQELYRILIGPMAKDLEAAGATTLMWSLDGVLRYIPVAALHDGNAYLVENYRNVMFSYGSLLRLKDPPATNWKGLGVGVSRPHPGFGALPAVPAELRGIIRDETEVKSEGGILPGKIMLDGAFTEKSLKTSLRSRSHVIHIASHFAFIPGNENDSYLLLGDGQHLTLAQVRDFISFNGVDLLTLSACNTAVGGGGGSEVDGLADIAQKKGAKAVIATLWAVADESTRLLMQHFYSGRESEIAVSKAEALRRAQLALLKGREKTGEGSAQGRGIGIRLEKSRATSYNHPFYWAPFILVGNWK